MISSLLLVLPPNFSQMKFNFFSIPHYSLLNSHEATNETLQVLISNRLLSYRFHPNQTPIKGSTVSIYDSDYNKCSYNFCNSMVPVTRLISFTCQYIMLKMIGTGDFFILYFVNSQVQVLIEWATTCGLNCSIFLHQIMR